MSLSIKDILKLHAGCEDLEVAPAGNGEVEVSVTVPAEEVPALIEEVEGARLSNEAVEATEIAVAIADETEVIEEEIAEVEEAVAGVEALLGASVLNRTAIDLLYRQAAKAHANLGGEEKGSIAGNEALEDEAAYRQAVIDGCEGFMDTVKKYYAATADFIKSVFYALVDGLKALFNFTRNQGDRASKLKKEIAEKEERGEISLGGWNRWFDGDFDRHDKALEKIATMIPKFGNLIKKYSDPTKFDAATNENMFKDVKSLVSDFELGIKYETVAVLVFGTTENIRRMSHDSHQIITWTVPDIEKATAADLAKMVGQFSFDIKATNQLTSAESAKMTGTVKPLMTKAEANSTLDAVVKTQELVNNLKKDVDGMKSSIDGAVTKLKAAPKEESDAAKVTIAALKRLVAKHSQLVTNYGRIVSSINGARISAVSAHF